MSSLYYDTYVGCVPSNPNGWTAEDEGHVSLVSRILKVLF